MSIYEFIRNKTQLSVVSLASLLVSAGCATGKTADSDTEIPTVSWQIMPVDSINGRCIQRFTVNHADSVEKLLFTQLPRPFKIVSEGDSIGEVNAGYYFLKSPKFGSGEKDIIIEVECEWPLRSISEGPESFHALTPGGRIIPVAVHNTQNMSLAAMNDEKWTKWVIPADSIYRLNQKLATGKTPGPFDIAPSFKKVEFKKGKFKAGSPIETTIIKHENPEYYRITLTPDKAIIEGASQNAVNMGRRMLERRLLSKKIEFLQCAVIEDWPDYPYRGLMIDIARNFQTPEEMRKIADLMADISTSPTTRRGDWKSPGYRNSQKSERDGATPQTATTICRRYSPGQEIQITISPRPTDISRAGNSSTSSAIATLSGSQ